MDEPDFNDMISGFMEDADEPPFDDQALFEEAEAATAGEAQPTTTNTTVTNTTVPITTVPVASTRTTNTTNDDSHDFGQVLPASSIVAEPIRQPPAVHQTKSNDIYSFER
jgi:hypothetical protein